MRALASLVFISIAVFSFTHCGGVTASPATNAGTTATPALPPAPVPPPVTPPPPPPPPVVTTYHNDPARTGLNAQETVLTPANVNASQFGKLFAFGVDGQIYGQPLYLANVSIPGQGTHNVVYVATEHDSVYAFDADGKQQTPLWHVSFINPAAGITTVDSKTDFPVVYDDISPEIGITSTPVIDPATGTIYVVPKTKENGVFFQRLHALDITTGAEKFGGPVVIKASTPGGADLNDGNGNAILSPLINLQRSALLLQNGIVYLAFASEGDFDPYEGWLLGYDAATLKQVVVFCVTPDGGGGSIWESGDGPAADSAGNIFVATSNGDYTAPQGGRDYSDSLLRLVPGNGGLQIVDWFTPFNFQQMNDQDLDFGSGGMILLPDQASGPAHLAIEGSKDGNLYVVNRDSMGHSLTANNSQIVQQLALDGPLFGSLTVFQDNVYISPIHSPLSQYKISGGQLARVAKAAETFGFPGSSPAVSSNGTSNAIVWTLQVDQFGQGPAILHAYDASNVSHELYSSTDAGDRDTAGTAVKFTVPTVINGKVYVGNGGQLTVYGLLP
ncbi:MAG: pyrrolo-quinoline quinone [Terriglobales bacterium]